MTAEIRSLDEGNLKRVYELAQRTNQLNFSGRRYSEAELRRIMDSPDHATYVIDCADRFGHYGVIGFAVVERAVPRLVDLMFSCRVQGKRVEHAVLSHLLRQFRLAGARDFYAIYRQTPKNTPGGRVFEEMGFERASLDGDAATLVFSARRAIPDDQLIEVKAPTPSAESPVSAA
jgi:FkbH-like protein